jgi:PAS domain S-box-containing protein
MPGTVENIKTEWIIRLAENSSDAMLISSNQGVQYVNPAFELLFDLQSIQVYENPDILQTRIRGLRIKDGQRELLRSKSDNQGNQFELTRPDGRKCTVWIRTIPLNFGDQDQNRTITLINDIPDHTRLEKTISSSRLQHKAILDNIPYLAWLKDKDGVYISVNEPFAQFFGMETDRIIGFKDKDIFPAYIAERHMRYDEAVRKVRKRKFIEDEWGEAGSSVWMETFTTSILDDKENLVGITGIARDITDRKSMEDTIIRNEEHFRALLQYSSDAITILDKNAAIIFESSLRNRISNFMIDELIGKQYHEIVHPEDVHIFTEVLGEVMEEPGTQIKREYRSLHKNKKWIYVESIFSNHLNNPSIRGIVVNTRDISDRKMAELKERVYHDNLIFLSNSALELLALSDREDIFRFIASKLKAFLEEAVIVVSDYDEQTNNFTIKQITGTEDYKDQINQLLSVNPIGYTFNRSLVASNQESAGNIKIFMGALNEIGLTEQEGQEIKDVLELLKVNKIYNLTMARDNKLLGNITILTLNKTIIKFKHIIETFVYQVSVALQRSLLEYELVQAKTKAEESDKLKTAFLANMSHEIRTPMNGILGFAEMLNDDQLGEGSRKKYVEIINNNGKILMDLIDDIIDFAKIEAGQIKVLNQEFSLNALLTQVHSSFLSETFKKDRESVRLRIRKALTNEECYIQSDPNRLRQILTNLVGNAFKFTREGYIEFGYELPEDDMIRFFVKDTGIGIPANKIDMIFERFVQADYSRSRKYSGSGLGLAISKGFVELMKGSMWVESKEGEGSTFYFTVQYTPSKKVSTAESESKKPKADYNWEGRLFLVAEDDTFSYKLLEGFLKKTQADILHAEDGAQAVKICRENDNIDLVLMDVQMPEMNGMEATRKIKEFREKLPVIAQTANAIAEEKQKCFEAGCDDFVTKPINISELFSKIDQWLTSP